MKVLLSRQDCDKVFNFLDKMGNGHLTFNQFCSIVEETQSRNIDAYKIQEIEEIINEKVKRELMQKETKKTQELDLLEKLSMASSHYTGFKAGKIVERKLQTQRIKGIHQMPQTPKDFKAYGVPNLPSDNMNDIMQN